MLTIYEVCRSRASRNIWLAHEIGLPFRHVPVMQAYRLADPDAPEAPLNTRSAVFLKINPNGHIPSLDAGDQSLFGEAIWRRPLARQGELQCHLLADVLPIRYRGTMVGY